MSDISRKIAALCIGLTRLTLSPHQTERADATAASNTDFDASGQLLVPTDDHYRVYLGSPPTPNASNGGKVGFPGYHDVHVRPAAYREHQWCSPSSMRRSSMSGDSSREHRNSL